MNIYGIKMYRATCDLGARFLMKGAVIALQDCIRKGLEVAAPKRLQLPPPEQVPPEKQAVGLTAEIEAEPNAEVEAMSRRYREVIDRDSDPPSRLARSLL